MRLLVVSDSHGHTDRLLAAAKAANADAIVHLGDHARDAAVLAPFAPVYTVQGNCDFCTAPEELLLTLEGKKIFITHGHRYHVKSDMVLLEQAARDKGAQAVLYGHTHIADYCFHNRMLLLNPGAIAGCRDTRKATYAILEWTADSQIYMTMSEVL